MAKATSGAQKALKVISVIAIFAFIFYLLMTAIFGVTWYYMQNIESPSDLAAAMTDYGVEGSTDDVIGTLKTLAISCGITAVLYLLIQILGFRAAKRPKHTKALAVVLMLAIILSVYNISQSFISEGATLDAGIALNLAGLLFVVTAFYLVIRIHKQYKEGTIPEAPEGSKTELGFISVIYAIFIFTVVMGVISLMFTIKGQYHFTFIDILSIVNIIFDAVSVWLIHQRSKGARGWIIAFSAVNILAQVAYGFGTGDFSLASFIATCGFDIFLILYFAFAKRPKLALTEDFDIQIRKERQIQDKELWQPKTWAFWRTLIIYFIIFSVVGHWMEAGYCTLIKWGIMPGTYDPNSGIWHDWLYPFPVYGFGMCACGLILFPIKNFFQSKFKGTIVPLLCSYVVNALVCGVIELTMGLMLNQPVNGVYPLWDYTNMFCNLWGQICLLNTSLFGLVATLMTWVVYPAITRWLRRMPNDINNVLFVETLVFYAIVMSLYAINIAM